MGGGGIVTPDVTSGSLQIAKDELAFVPARIHSRLERIFLKGLMRLSCSHLVLLYGRHNEMASATICNARYDILINPFTMGEPCYGVVSRRQANRNCAHDGRVREALVDKLA
jgi:hypothetical protein